MLSTFPLLLSYQFAVPFIFRVVVGLIFIWSGYKNFSPANSKNSTLSIRFTNLTKMWLWSIAILEVLGGVLLLAGLFTQITAIVLSLIIVASIARSYRKGSDVSPEQNILLLLTLITISLLFLGPGFYSLDLPI
ncbi:MAG: DoxX family membrane protein [Patescibacteria group bacterium]